MRKNEMNLKSYKLPYDLKKMSLPECQRLCFDIRRKIIRTVLKNGGHLSSNLGTVELSVALHRVFDSPKDKIVWDVGHQSYTHKILTGRYDDFHTLRQKDGISGFTKPCESEHDCSISGHSSTSISTALGIAEAMRLDGDFDHRAIAVIGDGAFTGGLAYEGLNNAGRSENNIIVILNHNDMSISHNVGALAKYLTLIRGNQTYLDTKKVVADLLEKTPVIGEPIKDIILSSKSLLKHAIYNSTLFESFGFVYLGPVNGHNLMELDEMLRMAKRIDAPVFIHVNTVKGKGYKPAEENPAIYHGISPNFSVSKAPKEDFSSVFGKALVKIAKADKNICAVTASMAKGTGLSDFAEKFPSRFYDVGIAEQHAVTFSGGLISAGKIPVFAVYSSFLQRSYDQIIHDISIANLHAVFAVDRAGAVGEDGPTHQGVFDIPIFTSIVNSTIFSPSNYVELEACLHKAIYKTSGVVAVRYPRGVQSTAKSLCENTTEFSYYKNENKSDVLAISFGRIIYNLYEAYKNLGGSFDILKLVKVFPIEDKITEIAKKYSKIIFFEESNKQNSIAQHFTLKLFESGYSGNIKVVAIEDYLPQDSVENQLEFCKLDSVSMAKEIEILNN